MIPLFDLSRVIAPFREKIEQSISECIESAHFINGPAVRDFEQKLENYLDSGPVTAVSSGTDALLAIFMSLGLVPGNEILVTPFSFVASATSIARAGLKPVFVDLEKNSFHPSIEEYEKYITPSFYFLFK